MSAILNLANIRFSVYHNHGDRLTRTIGGVVQIHPEDIAMEMFDGAARVMYNSVLRIPSHKNPANHFSLPIGYQMSDMMSVDVSDMLYMLSHAIGVHKDFNCSGPRKNLANSDLYLLKYFSTDMPYHGKGYEEVFLSQISEQIQSLTRDPHPVIVASPRITQNRWDISPVPGKTDKMEQMLLNTGFKPIRKTPHGSICRSKDRLIYFNLHSKQITAENVKYRTLFKMSK